jgi:transmembrane sensor
MTFRVDFLSLLRFPLTWLRERRLQRLTREALALVASGAARAPGFERALALWLLRSKDHVDVWLNVTAFYEEAARSLHYPEFGRIAVAINGCGTPRLPANGAPESLARLTTQRARAPQRKTFTRPIALAAVSIALATVVCGVLWLQHARGGEAQYATQIGEHRAIRLPDGSSVHLNTNSRIAVSFTPERRSVELIRGEALFDIVHDPRPFRVRSGTAVIEDLGTRFTVRLDARRIDVSVFTGQVRVGITPRSQTAAQPWPRIAVDTLRAGETVSIPTRPGAELPVVELASDEVLASRLAWTHGMLRFRGNSLNDAVSEFNRYNERQIRIVDPALGTLRIGGQFRATSPDRFAHALRSWGVIALEPEAGAPRSEPIRLVRAHP